MQDGFTIMLEQETLSALKRKLKFEVDTSNLGYHYDDLKFALLVATEYY